MRASFAAVMLFAFVVVADDEKHAFQAFVDAEIEKIKAMPEEQQWTYFRTSTTANRMDVLALALKAYHLQHGTYPRVPSMRELAPLLDVRIMEKVSTKDAWGNELRYVVSNDGKSYKLVSAGSDGRFDEASWTKRRRLAKADEDAVVESGEVVRHWDDDTKPGATPADVARAALDAKARGHLDRADALVKANDHAGALTAWIAAVKIDRRAATRELLDRYKPAVAFFAAEPTAEERAARERNDKALAFALRQYLQVHPGDVAATRELVNVSSASEAETLLGEMLRARPNDAELYALRGTARAGAGRGEDALADFTKAIELDPKNAERHYTLGVVLYELATKPPNVPAERKQELLRRGAAALERAEALRDGYFEAMTYRSLILRTRASLETDPARQAELTKEADALRERARALITARRTKQ